MSLSDWGHRSRGLKAGSWAEALDMYAAFPDARPLAGATDLVLELHHLK